MKGKWAAGIRPRNFYWIMKDRLAICERPGGRGESHRRVRRTEEITWIRQQGFNRVVSLIPSTHNLHNYGEQNIAWSHWPIADKEDYSTRLAPLFAELQSLLAAGEKLLVHRRGLDDVVVRLHGRLPVVGRHGFHRVAGGGGGGEDGPSVPSARWAAAS